ncbi:PDZK1-interacting protein 1 isoform X4 [Melanotaenia boesemani]|uniref:PDZK1-interacting protein 1 isoform X4 n=1 Tax=Melanotaenia boesemani TaxID=1250792 RepID=UPI001C0519FB|nr:PDZK1-interacting protein 1 isoform X4 [Melanotaenia boesemani]
MEKVFMLKACLLLAVGDVAAQTASPPSYERLLPQWLTGIIAVSGFLLLTFIGFLVKKVWCEESRRKNGVESVKGNDYVMSEPYDTRLDAIRNQMSVETEKENEYETNLGALRNRVSVETAKENEYETNLDALRNRVSVETAKENEYETNLDALRNRVSVETEKENECDPNLDALRTKDKKNGYDNLRMKNSVDKATPM